MPRRPRRPKPTAENYPLGAVWWKLSRSDDHLCWERMACLGLSPIPPGEDGEIRHDFTYTRTIVGGAELERKVRHWPVSRMENCDRWRRTRLAAIGAARKDWGRQLEQAQSRAAEAAGVINSCNAMLHCIDQLLPHTREQPRPTGVRRLTLKAPDA